MRRKYSNSLALEELPTPLCYQLRDKLLKEAHADPSKPSEESLGEILRKDPGRIFQLAGVEADPWQLDLIKSSASRVLTLCGRQVGKSFTAAAMAVAEALGNAPAEILILSKAQRQSKEVLRKAKNIYLSMQGDFAARAKISKRPRSLMGEVTRYNKTLERLSGVAWGDGDKTSRDNTEVMEFKNGSRIISLPGTPDTIVGYSAITLLIIDEAARTPDALYTFLSPTRATTEGRLIALTTPFGKRGWFYEAWIKCEIANKKGDTPPWKQVKIRTDQCPRISKSFLQDERYHLGDMWYSQEYEVEFLSVINSVFSYDDIANAVDPSLMPLIIPGIDCSSSSNNVLDDGMDPLEVFGVDDE